MERKRARLIRVTLQSVYCHAMPPLPSYHRPSLSFSPFPLPAVPTQLPLISLKFSSKWERSKINSVPQGLW